MKNQDFEKLPKSTKRFIAACLAFAAFLLVQLVVLLVAIVIKVVLV